MAIESATTLYHLLKGRAERAPHDIAAAAPEGSPLTYAQLLSQVHYVGKTLNSIGIGRNDVVAIVLPNGPEIAAAFLSVAANASCAPLNPSFSPGEFDFHLSAMKAKVLIVKTGMASRAAAAAQKQSIPIIEWSSVLDPATGLFLLMCDQPRHKTPGGFADAEDVALILSTSGTTSRPKLVPLSHSNLLASARNIARTLELTAKDRCLNVMPLFHVHGLVGALLSSIAAGSSVVCASTFDPERFLAWLETSRPTWYTAVPAMHRAILSSALSHKEILRRVPLRFIRSCSAALPVEVMQELENVFNVPVIEAYGMTEAAHQIASNPLPPRTRKAGSVGLPSGVEVAVMDDEGNIVTSHQTGEIAIRGPTVLTGYAENAVANEQSFRRGWFRTGDQGYLDADGYLFLMGRFDETINHGGEKVSPVEVDEVLAEHPAVSTAVTFPIPHSTLGQEIAAALVLRRGASVTEAEIQRFAATRLAHFKIPRRVLVVSTIPQTATGKIQRNRLAEKFGFVSRDGKITGAKPDLAIPRTQTERALASIWSLVLGVDVGIHDNFFHLGGDSIHIARIISRVRAAMGTELSVLSFFDTPTVAGMARTIDTVARESKSPEAALLQSVPRQEELPLSFAQQRLWFFEQLEPGNPAYNRPVALRLRGELQAQVLERCLSEIARRHEVLRANFHANGGQPTQIISPRLKLDLTIIDLSHLPDSERKAEALRRAVKESQQPFDLARGTLFRARLYRLSDQEHLLLIVTHHIVFDGWSENVLVGEISVLYRSFLTEESPPLPDLTVQYADYALWQQKQFESGAWEKDLTYWKRQLNKPFPRLNLPTDRPRPAVQTYRGAKQTLALPVSLAEQLKELSRREQVTLFMTLLAAFKTLLYRYTGQEEISVGVPTAGRNQVEIEPLVGVFINTLVLRTDLSGDPSFRELLRRTRNVALEAYSHQDLPFEKLIEVSRVERDLSRHPLFDVMFQLRNLPELPVTMPGLKVDSVNLDIGVAKFDLIMEIVDRTDALECRFEYNTDLFNPDTIRRMGGHYQTLLEGIVANSEQRLSELPLLTEAEKHQLLVEWNDTGREYPKDKCIHELFEEHVEKSPDTVAVVFEDQQLSYRELNQRANQLAHFLRKLGVGPETLIAFCVERSLEMIVGLLGILKAGGAYVPLDPSYPAERLEFMLGDAQVSVLLTQEGLLEDGGSRMDDSDCRSSVLDQRMQRICLDRDWALIARESDTNPESATTADNLAYVIYTSGSTGQPKGVQITHKSLLNLVFWHHQAFSVTPIDRATQLAGTGFDAAVWELWPYLTVGATIHIPDDMTRLDATAFRDWLVAQAITISFVPTALAQSLMTLDWPPETALRVLLTGGDALRVYPPDTLPFRVFNNYGPTECTVVTTSAQVWPNAHPLHPPTIGRPIANSQVYILDGYRNPVPIGVIGEIYIGGDGVARGYLNRQELTAEKFISYSFSSKRKSRLYRTGDRARYLPDGNIEFLGRIDDQVKIRGYRIELGEIEAVLTQHPAVRESAVIAREDRAGDKQLVAYIVPRESAPAIRELRADLKAKLPEYMVPSAFVFLDSLPLTPNGKVDRHNLPPPETLPSDRALTYVAPANDLEKTIAAIWRAALNLGRVGLHDNFFDVGGHSLLLVEVHRKMQRALRREIPIVTLFKYPTVKSLSQFLGQQQADQRHVKFNGASHRLPGRNRLKKTTATAAGGREVLTSSDSFSGLEIGIIGMACRFPGANTIEQFWRNLRDGIESTTLFSDDELRASGISDRLLNNPDYVKSSAIIEGADLFDAAFFGFNPKEAETTDPQHRLFLECSWEALENAGYGSTRYQGAIGVYAGAAMNSYLARYYPDPNKKGSPDVYQLLLGNDKDFLPTRVSYKLNLRGPSVNVQTACSTSLVAVHLACQGLLAGECDIALAGAVSIYNPQVSGYLYERGMIYSPDGHCRAFDVEAHGTFSGNGLGVVVLKRLTDALTDRDSIHAIIKGSAINNDGAEKVGYTAPSVDGQARVIRSAQIAANVHPETISYIEAHGTATELGDPVEIAAITKAFRSGTQKKRFCAIGSVKSNVGHLNTAAGIAGLIKTVLALKHKSLPPSLYFERPNPRIDFANSPFYVNAKVSPWPSGLSPRRAGVSSFGMGGTNAHVILEEAPAQGDCSAARPYKLIQVSAQTRTALDAATANLAEYLKNQPDLNLADVAYTQQIGRTEFNHRRAVICHDLADAVTSLECVGSQHVFTSELGQEDPPVVFMFGGHGSQHVNMALGLYETEPTFRAQFDACAEFLNPFLGLNLRDVVYPGKFSANTTGDELNNTRFAQPALFVVEYALAKLLLEWGIKPQAMIGHSVGEYVAACVAEVFSLEDALRLVAERGRLMCRVPSGSMIALSLSRNEILPYLTDELTLAVVNGPRLCVVAGPEFAVTRLETEVSKRGIGHSRLHTSHGFHSPMMESIVEPFAQIVRKVKLSPPTISYLSNVSGTWITDEQATDPEYWAKHIRQTVLFSQGLSELAKHGEKLFLEVGPGQALAAIVNAHSQLGSSLAVISCCRHAQSTEPDAKTLLTSLAKAWLAGVSIDWPAYHAHEQRRRVPLPTYPFERQRYWIELDSQPRATGEQSIPSGKKSDIADWFYAPSWNRSESHICDWGKLGERKFTWLVFVDECGAGREIVKRLQLLRQNVITVKAEETYRRVDAAAYTINPRLPSDYKTLLDELFASGHLPEKIIHLWSLAESDVSADPLELWEKTQDLGCFSVMFLAQALGSQKITHARQIYVVSNNIQEVTGEETVQPEKATVLGLCKVIPVEYSNISCRSIDITLDKSPSQIQDAVVSLLLSEFALDSADIIVAHRGRYRWRQTVEPIHLAKSETSSLLRNEGVYLITGGLGGIGFELADHLAKTLRAKLVLTRRSFFPAKEQWARWLTEHDTQSEISVKIHRLRTMEDLGAQVFAVPADVSSSEQMREVVAQAETRFGAINGVIHCAGIADYAGIIQRRTREATEQVLAPKIRGMLVLQSILKDVQLDFIVLFSSLGNILYQGKFGQVGYSAANEFLDAFAYHHGFPDKTSVVAVNWCDWQEVGMSVESVRRWAQIQGVEYDPSAHKDAMSISETIDVFHRVINCGRHRVAVYNRDLIGELNSEKHEFGPALTARLMKPKHSRPELKNRYVAPTNATEQTLGEIWKEVLGLEKVGIHDNFFDLGGHSLLATQMIARIRQLLGTELPLRAVFEATTVEKMAVMIIQEQSKQSNQEDVAAILSEVESLTDKAAERLSAQARK